MGATKYFGPLGAKELDCITSWDISIALEIITESLWEHFSPPLFGGS